MKSKLEHLYRASIHDRVTTSRETDHSTATAAAKEKTTVPAAEDFCKEVQADGFIYISLNISSWLRKLPKTQKRVRSSWPLSSASHLITAMTDLRVAIWDSNNVKKR